MQAIRFATNVWKSEDDELIHDKTISESVHRNVGTSGANLRYCFVLSISSATSFAAHNSSRGIVTFFVGATLDFAHNSRTMIMPSLLVDRV